MLVLFLLSLFLLKLLFNACLLLILGITLLHGPFEGLVLLGNNACLLLLLGDDCTLDLLAFFAAHLLSARFFACLHALTSLVSVSRNLFN